MTDLGFAIKEGEKVVFELKEQRLELSLKSKDFNISGSEALKVSCEKFKDLLNRYTSGNSLKGECYLKILGLKGDDNNLFWCFTFVGSDNKSFNLIISIQDGSVLVSDF